MMITAPFAVITSFIKRMSCQLTAYRTYLCGRKTPAYDIDVGTVLQSPLDDAHGGMLDFLSE